MARSDIDTAGEITFRPALGERGTEVHVYMNFIPPAGGLARIASELADQESLTPTDLWLGTPDFIAPEQAKSSKGVDIRIFGPQSLGDPRRFFDTLVVIDEADAGACDFQSAAYLPLGVQIMVQISYRHGSRDTPHMNRRAICVFWRLNHCCANLQIQTARPLVEVECRVGCQPHNRFARKSQFSA